MLVKKTQTLAILHIYSPYIHIQSVELKAHHLQLLRNNFKGLRLLPPTPNSNLNHELMFFVLKLDIHVKRPLVLASVHTKPTKNVVHFSGRFGHKITSPVASSNSTYVLKCFSKLILY